MPAKSIRTDAEPAEEPSAASNKATTPAAKADPAPAPATPAVGAKEAEGFPMPLHHFCAALSGTDKRSTLIAAFCFDEEANGRLLDTEGAYRDRFAALAKRPA